MSQNFDWEFYLVYYPDLKKNGLATQKQAEWHYNRHGKKEGRIGNKNEVDWQFYLKKYPDLKNAGLKTMRGAKLHYVNYGIKEGRIPNRLFELKKQRINLIGFIDLNCSISENLELLKMYYEKKNFEVILADIRKPNEISLLDTSIETIICVQPFELHMFNFSRFENTGNLSAFWVWEFKNLAPQFSKYASYFNTIYTPSTFCKNVFQDKLMTPVKKIPLTSFIHKYSKNTIHTHVITNQKINSILETTKNKTIYGFCFDLNSSIVRKNPLNLVKAFNKINDISKVLILKYRLPRNNMFANKTEKDIYHEFVVESTTNPNIYHITDELSQLDLYKLYTNFDYYISPHCGEGFGITIYDNMILGNKIITPYYSGETEYLEKEEIIELEYEEKEIPGLREHPIYGTMSEYKGAYISVESIEKCLNSEIKDEIYILGNGPSLKNVDFQSLKDKTTFALNSSYKKFAELDFYPTYFGCFDPKLIECHYKNFISLMNTDIKKFFFLNENNKGQKQFSSQDESHLRYQKINFIPPQETYINPSRFNAFYKMHNSGATAALISILLGYKKIILLGCDGNYVEQIPEARIIDASTKTLQILKTPEKNPNYWFDNYQEKGEIYSVPDGNNCHMKGWEILHQASKFHNVEIINENPESKIPYFKKKSPKICFYYGRRNNPNLKYSGINRICDYIFDNLSHYLDYNIIDDYKESSDIVISTYDELDDNYSRCRIIIVHDLIYLYNKEKTDTQGQFNKINSILSSIKKKDFIIFTTKYQQNKYLENKDKYDFKVSKENTDIIYLPYRFKENKTPEKLTQKYDFFILLQYCARKNPDLYEKYIEKLDNFKFCLILSDQLKEKIEDYKKIYQHKHNVDIFYNCDNRKFTELISLSKYCLYLTDDEGTGLHAIECLYNNCIPIVKNNIVFNEILGNNCYYIKNIYDINNSIIEINNIAKENKKIVDLDSEIFKKFDINYFCKHMTKLIDNFYSIYLKNNKFVNNINDFSKEIKPYQNSHDMILIIIPQFELVPFAIRVMNEFDKNKKKIIIYYNGVLNDSVINFFLSQENAIIYELKGNFRELNELLQQININNIRFDTFITHNFYKSEIMYNLFIKDINLVNICCYSDGSRNNSKAESTEQSILDIQTILNQNNIPNTLYFFGFIHSTYINNTNNIKILKYDENIYPKINNNLQKYENIGLILTRYFGKADYTFNKNINIEKVMIEQIYKLFDNSTNNHIKLDKRITLRTSELMRITKYKNFEDIISNSSNQLMETILLNNIEYCSNIKKIYCFDSSFPLLFQLPTLYNNLNKNATIYTGFSKEIFYPVATKKCINLLIKRTIEVIINLNKLNLFDIHLKDKLIKTDETFDQIKKYDDFLFTLKKK